MHTGRFDSPARDYLNVRARDTFRAVLIASACALSACSSMKITSRRIRPPLAVGPCRC